MAIDRSELEMLLKNAFPNDVVEVRHLADDNDHYSVVVVSKKFAGKSKLEQHRMVYSALSGTSIHALQISTSMGNQDG